MDFNIVTQKLRGVNQQWSACRGTSVVSSELAEKICALSQNIAA